MLYVMRILYQKYQNWGNMNYMQRKIITYILLIILFYGSLVFAQTAQTVFISFLPEEIRQGDPFMAQIDSAKISSIKKLTFNGKKMGTISNEITKES